MGKSKRKILKEQESRDVAKSIIEINTCNESLSQTTTYKEMLCRSVLNYMTENEVDEIVVGSKRRMKELPDGMSLIAQKIERTKVVFDPEKVRGNVTPQQWSLCVDRSFVISESGLKTFLKHHPELREELRRFITKQELFNSKKLDDAYDRGLIPFETLDGCYRLDVKPYIKVTQKKGSASK